MLALDFGRACNETSAMRVFGEELGDVGRWYVALPPILLLGLLAGLFVLANAGQSRLAAANDRVHRSQSREQALSDFLAQITSAESAQRGYMLTSEDSYLEPYAIAVAATPAAVRRLEESYGSSGAAAEVVGELRSLTEAKLAELDETMLAFRRRDREPFNVQRVDAGKTLLEEIRTRVAALQAAETAELSAATLRWREDLVWSRRFIALGATLNLGLVLLAMWLVSGEMRRRARQADDLRDQKQDLERLVAERTRELTALSTHLQQVSEQEKAGLSRELHDELGSLLIAARMDLSWLELRLPTSDPAIAQRFKRIHDSLSAGVDLKRRVVEELRPTLLDNMGLYAALRWQFRESCRRSGLQLTESIPDEEPAFDALASIAIFRVCQEALTNILKHARARSAQLTVEISADSFTMRISDDGVGAALDRVPAIASHGLASMRHRVAALGGILRLSSPPSGGTVVTVIIPRERVLAAETRAQPSL
jgi:signal transduction histidine kinase